MSEEKSEFWSVSLDALILGRGRTKQMLDAAKGLASPFLIAALQNTIEKMDAEIARREEKRSERI